MKISVNILVTVFISFMLCSCHPKKKRPNILFCLADDVSYPHMGAYGCKWVKTPAFDKIAEQGLLFNNAYTPNAKCAPSRSAILTGRNSWQLKEAANHFCYFPKEFRTYPEVLAGNGYFVGSTGKKWAPGEPGRINGKRRQLTGKGWDKEELVPTTKEISNNNYAANFKQFLKNKPQDQPFCFWFGSLEPHRAYEFNSSVSKGGLNPNSIDEVPGFWPDIDSVRIDMMDYAYELNHFDQHLGMMLNCLEDIGELDNTLVVVTSDNGMPFPRVKGQAYEFSNHLPMAVMWKDGIRKPGRKIDDFVSFIDLAPTFLELAQVDEIKSGMKAITGRSLLNIFQSSKEGQVEEKMNFVLIGKERHDIGRPDDQGYPIRGIVQGDYLYIKNFKNDRWPVGNPETGYPNADASPTKTQVLEMLFKLGKKNYWQLNFGKRREQELYNIKEDPYCLSNLIDSIELKSFVEALSNKMNSLLKEQNDPRIFGKGDVFDSYKYSGKDSMYYNRRLKGEDIEASWLNSSDRNYIPNN